MVDSHVTCHPMSHVWKTERRRAFSISSQEWQKALAVRSPDTNQELPRQSFSEDMYCYIYIIRYMYIIMKITIIVITIIIIVIITIIIIYIYIYIYMFIYLYLAPKKRCRQVEETWKSLELLHHWIIERLCWRHFPGIFLWVALLLHVGQGLACQAELLEGGIGCKVNPTNNHIDHVIDHSHESLHYILSVLSFWYVF